MKPEPERALLSSRLLPMPLHCRDSGWGLIRFAEQGLQGLAQVGVVKGVTAGDEADGFDAVAGEQGFVGHAPVEQAQGERGNREHGGTRENRGEGFGEVGVGNRAWSYEIHRALEEVGLKDVVNSTHQILNMNPTHPLAAGADAAAEAQAERQEHVAERASIRAQHDAEAGVRGANADFARGTRSRLPFAANFWKEAGADGALFGQGFVPAIAIEADGGRGDEYVRLFFGPGESL